MFYWWDEDSPFSRAWDPSPSKSSWISLCLLSKAPASVDLWGAFSPPLPLCLLSSFWSHPHVLQPSVSHTMDPWDAQVVVAGGHAPGECESSQPAPSLLWAALQLRHQWKCWRDKSPTVNQEAVAKIGEKQMLKSQWFLTASWWYPHAC